MPRALSAPEVARSEGHTARLYLPNCRQHIVCEAICSSTFSAKRSAFALLDATQRRRGLRPLRGALGRGDD